MAATMTGPLTPEQRRHLLRRLAFAATPALEHSIDGLSADAAVDVLLRAATTAPMPEPPPFIATPWVNTAVRMRGMTDADYDARRPAYLAAARQQTDDLRRWWVAGMIGSPAPLREQLTLFFHSLFGCTTTAVDVPHALYASNALMREACTGTVPDLLDRLVLEPAMLIQIGMDGHRRLRVSDRPAKLVLDHWTVGAGHYADHDVEALSRALTGWTLAPEPGEAAVDVDPAAPLVARRLGLRPVFDPAQFDARPKTLLGISGAFDARGALRLLALHEATAARVTGMLLEWFGVADPRRRLRDELAGVYRTSGGAIDAIVRAMVRADEFWAPESRWLLIKSPVHLAVGACRQLELDPAPIETIVPWLAASGQSLFDTPNAGEGGWPGQRSWVTPPDRLAIRYQLPVVLAGRQPALGLAASRPVAPPAAIRSRRAMPATPHEVLDRLDPSPGLELRAIAGGRSTAAMIRRVMATPNYQLA